MALDADALTPPDDLVKPPDDLIAAPAAQKPPSDLIGASPASSATAEAPIAPLDERRHAAPAWEIARASLAPEQTTQIKRYAEYFGQPEADFRVVGGNIVRRLPETGEYARVEPSLRGGSDLSDRTMRVLDWVASGAGPAIPAITGGAGAAGGALLGAPSGPGALATGVAGGAAGSAAGEYGRQILDRALAGDDQTGTDWTNVGWQGVAGAAGPVVGAAAGALGRRVAPAILQAAEDELPAAARGAFGAPASAMQRATDFGLSQPTMEALRRHIVGREAELAQLRSDAQALGLDLSLGQMTGSTAVQQAERQLARQPEGADIVAALRRSQNEEQIPGAVRNVLGGLAPERPQGQAVSDFRDAAETVVNQALQQRSAAARQAYAAALDNREPIWNADLAELMRRPSMAQAWGAAQKLAAEDGTKLPDVFVPNRHGGLDIIEGVSGADLPAQTMAGTMRPVPDWRSWDYLKRGLDSLIESNTNEFGRVNAMGRAITNTKRQLLSVLDTANPDYAAARAQYGSASDATQMILDGGVGFINKLSGPDRQSMVNRVFSGQNLMPDEIARMRGQFAAAGKLPEWNAGVRSYVEDKLASALTPVQSGELSNVGGKMYKGLWGDARQADVIRAAMGDAPILDRWEKLGNVLRAAAHQLPEGSPTATDTASPGLVRRVTQAAKYVTRPTAMAADVIDGLAAMQDPAKARKMAQYLMTPDGDKVVQAVTAKPQPPMSPQMQAMLGSLFVNAGVARARATTSPSEP